MSDDLRGPKCTGPMEGGFVIDRGHYNQALQSKWIPGEPANSFWVGAATRVQRSAAVPITTLRCSAYKRAFSSATSPSSSARRS